MEASDIQKSIKPLRLIFWGAIICVLDFKFNGFDIINDVIGTIMIAWGVFRLADIPINDRYASAMRYVKILAILSILMALQDHFSYPVPKLLSIVFNVFGLAKVVAVVVFCMAMNWFCDASSLEKSKRSWKTTTVLFAVIYLIPLGLFNLAALLAMISGETFRFNFGPLAALVIIAVFVIPLVHLFMSTSRMKNEASLTVGTNGMSDQIADEKCDDPYDDAGVMS
jgi:hypothetical protein